MAEQEPVLELIDYDTLPPDLQAAVDRERKLVAGGVPLPTAAQPGPMFTKPIVPGGMGEGFTLPKWSDVATLGLPIGGGALGGKLASLLSKGGVARAFGMGAGSATGTAASQQAGLEPPSGGQIALSGALAGAPGLTRGAARWLPGAQAGQQAKVLEDVGYAAAAAAAKPGEKVVLPWVAKRIPIGTPADVLYKEVEAAGGAAIPTQAVSNAVASLRESFTTRGAKLVDPAATRMVEGVDSLLKTASVGATGTARLSALRDAMQYLRRQARSSTLTGEARDAARRLENGIWDAMEAAEKGTGPAIEKLRAANTAYRRQKAQEELSDLLWAARSTVGGVEQVLGDAALTKFLRKEATFAKRIDAKEVAAIREGLRDIAKVPGLQSGMISFAQRVPVTAAITGLGGAFGGGPGAVGGAVAGVAATEAIAHALTTKSGRALIKFLVKHDATFDQVGNAALQLARAGLLEDQQAAEPWSAVSQP